MAQPSTLPYRATTSSGEVIDVTFDLHAETRSASDVTELLTALLGALDERVTRQGNVSNGDVMQALAMALAVRTAMLHAPYTVGQDLATALAAHALAAAGHCERDTGAVGNA